MKAQEYSEHRILAIPADVNEDGQVFYLDADLGVADDEHNGLSGEIEMAFDNGRGYAMLEFKEYLESLIPVYQEQANCFKKDIMKYNNPIERIRMSSEANGKLSLINKIINEFFKENNESKNN